jgi:predicted small secreted protein
MKREMIIVLILASLAFAACGTRPEISDEAGADLRSRALEITRDVSRLDVAGARTGLTGLRNAVNGWKQRDELTEERAQRVLAAASRVEEKITELEARLKPAPATEAPTGLGQDSKEGDERRDDEGEKGKGQGKDRKEESDD